jgi:hypothetical protein
MYEYFRRMTERLAVLDALAKLRKGSATFAMSVCSSIRLSSRMEQLGSRLTDFHKI